MATYSTATLSASTNVAKAFTTLPPSTSGGGGPEPRPTEGQLWPRA